MEYVWSRWSVEYLDNRARLASEGAAKRGASGSISGIVILHLLKEQRLLCNGCERQFSGAIPFDIDHRMPVSKGGMTNVEKSATSL